MTDLQCAILESSSSGLLSISEANQMISMMYESESFTEKLKKAWEAFKKWVHDIVVKIQNKISEVKLKLTGKGDIKTRVRYDLKKVKKLTDDVIKYLKPPYDSEQLETLSSIGISAFAFTTAMVVAYSEDIVVGIKDNLLKIEGKLNDLEAKNGDSKIIKILRPIISLCNSAIASIVLAETDDEFEGSTNYMINRVKAKRAGEKPIGPEAESIKQKMDAFIKKYNDSGNYAKCNDLESKMSEVNSEMSKYKTGTAEYNAELVKYMKLNNEYDKVMAIHSKFIVDLTLMGNKYKNAVMKFERNSPEYKKWSDIMIQWFLSVYTYSGPVIRRSIANITRLMNDKNISDSTKKTIIVHRFDAADTAIEEFYKQSKDMDLGDKKANKATRYTKYKREVDAYARQIKSLKSVCKSRGLI